MSMTMRNRGLNHNGDRKCICNSNRNYIRNRNCKSQLNYFTLFDNTAEGNVRVPDFAVDAVGGPQRSRGSHKVRFENLGVIDRSNNKIAPY